MNIEKVSLWAILLASFCSLCAPTAKAQFFYRFSTDGVTPPSIQGGNPPSSYATSKIDNVNLYNGNLTVTVPLLTVGGRGTAGYNIVLPIGTRWQVERFGVAGYQGSLTTQPWDQSPVTTLARYSPGLLELRRWSANAQACSDPQISYDTYDVGPYVTRFVWYSADGTQTTLVDSKYNGQAQGPAGTGTGSDCPAAYNATLANRGTVFTSTDGSGLKFVANSDVFDSINDFAKPVPQITGTLFLRDGTRYTIDTQGRVTQIEDRNGNLVTLAYSYDPNTFSNGLHITDSVGRSITIVSGQTNGTTSQDTITYPGPNNTSHTITVNYEPLSNLLTSGTPWTYGQLFPEINGTSTQVFNMLLCSSIVLADGVSEYSFKYNPYGDVAQVTLPTGGIYQYTTTGFNGGDGALPVGPYTNYSIYRRLVERDELSDGVNYSAKTSYQVKTHPATEHFDPNHPNRSVTEVQVVTTDPNDPNTPLGQQEIHYFYGDPSSADSYPSLPTNYPSWSDGEEFRTLITEAAGNLQLKQNVWQQRPCAAGEDCWFNDPQADTSPTHDPQLCQVNTTVDGTDQSSVVLIFDQYNNPTNKFEFDYGAAPPVGATCPTSQTGAERVTNIGYDYDYAAGQNILDLPSTIEVIGNHTGSGGESSYSKRTLTYDGVAPPQNTSIPSHDGVVVNRGNLSLDTRTVDNQKGTSTSTRYEYDAAGNITKITDPNGNATQFAYTDGTYAHPNRITNAAAQIVIVEYDNNIGKPSSVTDVNSVKTNYIYGSDPFDRLQSIQQAAGQTGAESDIDFSYPDLRTVYKTQDQNTTGDGAIKSATLYDGFGRVAEQDTYESGSKWLASMTTYDAWGRVRTQSNPSEYTGSGNDGLGYLTTYRYDLLGRITTVVAPGNATTSINYSGKTSAMIDPQQKARQMTTDSLGRVTQIVEDPLSNLPANPSPLAAHFNFTTTYTYDALNDLVNVTQGGQTRHFIYDSEGRLLYAQNPENGQVAYTYYDGGNIKTRTDARGVLSVYHYDNLNRLVDIVYSGPTSTPMVNYIYDKAIDGSAVPFANGRLTAVGNPNAATFVTSYDALGRITGSAQQVAVTGQTYSFGYTYNLAGSLVTETYPSGRTVTNSYDPANRVMGLTGNSSGQLTNYVQNVSYTSQGIKKLEYGNHLWRTYLYNSQLQESALWDAVEDNPYQYLFIENPINWGTTNNNGTVQGITMYAGGPAESSSLATFQQVFQYDNLNRIVTASDTGGWSRGYNYDQFGNAWTNAGSANTLAVSGVTPQSNVFDASTNRIDPSKMPNLSLSYDPAGNLITYTTDTITYDAENHQVGIQDSLTGGTATYRYDGAGRRVVQNNAVYVYDALGQLAAEYTTGSVPSAPCITCYLSADYLGSIRLVTDRNGKVVARHDYLPFGEEIPANGANRNGPWGSGADNIAQKFTGAEHDANGPGFDFFQARYFSSVQGRFTSPDPGNAGADIMYPQSWNAYAYVMNNPLNAVDPSGLDADPCADNPNCVTVHGSPPPPIGNPSYPGCIAEGTEGCIPFPPCTLVNVAGCLGSLPPGLPGSGGGGISNGGGGNQKAGNQPMPPKNQSPLPPQIQACDSAILNAVNTKFKTSFTDTNVTRRFQFSKGAADGQGTLNLNISVPAAMQPTKVAVGRYPVNPATYVLGAGATLHIPPGPGGADSPLTLPFNASQFTAHLDSALPYNPIGLLTHLLQDMSSLGGYKPCP